MGLVMSGYAKTSNRNHGACRPEIACANRTDVRRSPRSSRTSRRIIALPSQIAFETGRLCCAGRCSQRQRAPPGGKAPDNSSVADCCVCSAPKRPGRQRTPSGESPSACSRHHSIRLGPDEREVSHANHDRHSHRGVCEKGVTLGGELKDRRLHIGRASHGTPSANVSRWRGSQNAIAWPRSPADPPQEPFTWPGTEQEQRQTDRRSDVVPIVRRW